MAYQISLIGAINSLEIAFSADTVRDLLQAPQTELAHGETFTGRPDTRIHVNQQHILKIRTEIRNRQSAQRWAQQALDKERKLGVYHPHKTWFVATPDDAEKNCIIGNICPLLRPLHKILAALDSTQAAQGLVYLEQLWDMYFAVAVQHELRLDEGLSNFGLDAQDTLHYLDDDTYSWDRFNAGAHVLGVYLRSLAWLEADPCQQLGLNLHRSIMQYFKEKQYLNVLAGQLDNVFIPPKFEARFKALNLGLIGDRATQRSNTNSRYLILMADIHANLPALEAVLAFMKREGIRDGLVLGDVVGYGPHPTQCIERLQEAGLTVIKGNHDQGLASGNFKQRFSLSAQWVLNWSSERVNAAHKQWLADLPPVLYHEHWMALHGAPVDPTFFNAYVYHMTFENNLENLAQRNIPLCFHGHTHIAGVYARRGMDKHYADEQLDLTHFQCALVCPGSVGQPRNGVAGAQLAIYDQMEKKLTFKRLSYPNEALIETMQSEGFPEPLIQLLR